MIDTLRVVNEIIINYFTFCLSVNKWNFNEIRHHFNDKSLSSRESIARP